MTKKTTKNKRLEIKEITLDSIPFEGKIAATKKRSKLFILRMLPQPQTFKFAARALKTS